VHPCTSPRAVIIAPTRELAVQIHKDAEQLGRYTGFRLGLVFGGTGYDSQRRQLESGVDVLIATPGRMIDYFKQRLFDLKSVQVMILDEADRMFDLGFIKDIRFILRRMPPPDERLNMLFSATLSYRVTELAYEHMNNPQFIRIEPDKRTVDKVEQRLYHVAIEEKRALLIGLLRRMDPTRTLVFVNTKDTAESLVAQIQGNGFSAEVLSGDVPQKMRLRLLQDFIEGRLPILVATDVMARGLHIPDVSHVFNFDLPQNAEDYVHRIGRTARAGKSGDAISFACERYVFSLMEIEAYLGHKIQVASVTPELLAELAPPAPRARREERGGRRPGRGGNRREAGRAPREGRATPPSGKNRSPGRRAKTSMTAPRKKSDSEMPANPRKPEESARASTQTPKRVTSGRSRRAKKPGPAARPRRSGSNKPVIG
jgi:ATP-dependent RNA helicase RhlB